MNSIDIKLKQERKTNKLTSARISFTDSIRQQVIDKVIDTVTSNTNSDIAEVEYNLLVDVVEDVKQIGHYDIDTVTKRLLECIIDVNRDVGKEIKVEIEDLGEDFMIDLLADNIKGKNFSERIWHNNMKLADELADVIGKYVTDKDINLDNVAKDISRRFEVDNYTASRLVHNEVARVESKAKLESYRRSKVIEEVEFISMEDDRVTEICQSLHGNIYDVNDPNMPRIPEDTHVGCRSFYRPRVKDMDKYKFS